VNKERQKQTIELKEIFQSLCQMKPGYAVVRNERERFMFSMGSAQSRLGQNCPYRLSRNASIDWNGYALAKQDIFVLKKDYFIP
jgi:hypothetical protein